MVKLRHVLLHQAPFVPNAGQLSTSLVTGSNRTATGGAKEAVYLYLTAHGVITKVRSEVFVIPTANVVNSTVDHDFSEDVPEEVEEINKLLCGK